MPKFISPKFLEETFTCPHCDVTSHQAWYGNDHARKLIKVDFPVADEEEFLLSPVSESVEALYYWQISKCDHCEKIALWHCGELIYPPTNIVEGPNADMPEDVKRNYLEAAKVVGISPKSAAALLRLALQTLLKEILGEESTGKIYNDIQILKKKRLSNSLIKALDIIRINGNESVYPGTINLNDEKHDAIYLFELMNVICDQCFTQPKKIEDMYEKLPENKRIL